jgi:urease subunit gamma/beta
MPIAGARVVRGHGELVDGPLDEPGAKEAALAAARDKGYRGAQAETDERSPGDEGGGGRA